LVNTLNISSKFKKISNFQNSKKYFENGFSISKISHFLELNRRTVKKYVNMNDLEFSNLISSGEKRLKKLDLYKELIEDKLFEEPELSAHSIFIWLNDYNPANISVSEKTVFNFVKTIRKEKNITKKQIDNTWFKKIITGIINKTELYESLKNKINHDDYEIFYKCLTNKSIAYRKRATSLLLYLNGEKSKDVSSYLNIEKKTIDSHINKFITNGISQLFDFTKSITKKTENTQYKDEVFKILHSPPTLFGINRTSWKYEDIERTLKAKGFSISKPLIRKILKNAGFSMKKARRVLTSNDPKYLEKLKEITNILSNLGAKDKFFSIDEYGPFSIKIQGGKSLTKKDEQKTFPQWQRSKGKLILTGALELSTNQMTYFYSDKKNTNEMIKLLYVLLEQYKIEHIIYLSWDAASWHISKELKDKVQDISTRVEQGVIQYPIVKLCPLPSSAQFLNVIESVYSGMARAIIHNSDYQSKDECKAAIDRYFLERNEHFKIHPKVAGNKIWGKERVKSEFNESNNCKDPNYR
jgi:transposase